jgi:hypothetical protein
MRLACTTTTARAALDPLLHDVAFAAMAHGLHVAGVVQINSETGGGRRCDMDALVLPAGPRFRISQSLGRESRGCRLDPEGLERAVAAAEAELRGGADLLIVNKFGKQEAAGRGFRPVIADALERGAAVLVGVSELNLPALEAFVGEPPERLRPDLAALLAWCVDGSAAKRLRVGA